jgi:hypothetical protein
MTPSPTARDISIDPERGGKLGLVISAALFASLLLPYQALWGVNALKPAFAATGWVGAAVLVLVAIAVHEALHGLGWHYGGPAPRPQVQFGVQWKVLMPYAHPTSPMTVRRYRLGALAPGVLMGLAPGMVGIVLGEPVLTGWAAIFWGFAAGDLMVVATLRELAPDTLVLDHPQRIGCTVVGADALPGE